MLYRAQEAWPRCHLDAHDHGGYDVACRRGRQCDVGDEGGGQHYSERMKRHDYEWFVDNTREQDVGTNDDGVEGAI